MSILELRPDACFRFAYCAGCKTLDWLRSDNNLCYDCRRKEMDMTQQMTVVPPAELRPTSEALAEYLSPEAQALVLSDDQDLALAASIINDIKQRAKVLEELEKSVTRPILEGVNRYRDLFREPKRKAVEARVLWDGKIRTFADRQAEAQQAAEAALQEAITTENAPAATAAIQAFVQAPAAPGLIIQDGWDFEERNHDIVPSSLTATVPGLVRVEIKRQLDQGVLEPAIPGLRVFRKQTIKATGR